MNSTKRISALILAVLAALTLTACRANGGVSVTSGPALTSPESTLGDPGKGAKNDLENGSGDGYVTNSPRGDAGHNDLIESGGTEDSPAVPAVPVSPGGPA